MEDAEKQAGEIEGRKDVNQILGNGKKSGWYVKSDTRKIKRYRCGLEGHKSMDKSCKAWGQTCRRCKGKDHFERVYKSKQNKEDHIKVCKEKSKRVRQVEEGNRYAFTVRNVNDASGDAKIEVNVGGIPVNMIIDQNLWEHLKSKNIGYESTKCQANVYSYGSKDPLPVLGKFTAKVSVGQTNLDNIEFIVMKGSGQALLGCVTASALGVLRLGPNVHAVNKGANAKDLGEHEIFAKYPGCCDGIGKLKDYQLKIPIDSDVQPIAQPMRRVSYQLRDKVKK